jgi:hypothetical protein
VDQLPQRLRRIAPFGGYKQSGWGREKSVRVPEVIPLLLRKRACRARRRHQSEGVAPKDRTEHEPATFAYAALQAVFIKIGAAAARAARDL